MSRITILVAAVVAAIALSAPAGAHTVAVGKGEKAHAAHVECVESFTPRDYRRYASRVYKRSRISKRAHSRLWRMHICQASYVHRVKVGQAHRSYYRARRARIRAARRPVITPLMDCIMKHESTYNPLAQNGQYKGLAQWSPEAWSRMGGLRFGPTPHHASYWEQVQILAYGLKVYGCRDWCPFDPC